MRGRRTADADADSGAVAGAIVAVAVVCYRRAQAQQGERSQWLCWLSNDDDERAEAERQRGEGGDAQYCARTGVAQSASASGASSCRDMGGLRSSVDGGRGGGGGGGGGEATEEGGEVSPAANT